LDECKPLINGGVDANETGNDTKLSPAGRATSFMFATTSDDV
jgi:hypothetical protein